MSIRSNKDKFAISLIFEYKYKIVISISSVPFISSLNKYKYGSYGRHKHFVKTHKVQVDRIILMTQIGTRPEIPRKS